MNKNSSKLFSKARRILKHPSLDLLVAPTDHEPGTIMVVTPARIGNAVQRNTIRRRLKALFHEHQLNKNLDCIIIVKKMGPSLAYEDLKAIILPAFSRPNYICS
jgi:ribonuclease P protein component